MRTSLNKIKEIEEHLFNASSPEASLLLEARMIIDPEIKEEIAWQSKSYDFIRAYGRKRLREEIETVHQKLFTESAFSSFRNKILNIFSK